MKTHKICLLVFLCCFMFFQQASAINTDLSSYITMLEEAAEVCDNSMFSTSKCSKVCTASAEQFKQVKTLSGLSANAKNAILNCMTAMAANDDGRNSPLFNQIGALQATLSSALFKLKIADYGRQALTKANTAQAKSTVQQVNIDTNIYDTNGNVNTDKIPPLYDDLSQRCQSQSVGMIKLCTEFCESTKIDIVKMLHTISQAPKNISNADKQRNAYNLMFKIDTDINFSCAKLFKEMPSTQQPKSYKALNEFVGLIKNGSWPAKPALSLDLNIDEPAPEEKQASQIASLKAASALTSFSFTQAVTVIKSMPDYVALEKAVKVISFSPDQIYSSLSDLIAKEANYESQRQQWQDKVQQLGIAGRQKNLYEAVNSSCDMNYLRTYNQQINWHIKIVDTMQDIYGNAQKAPFAQILSPVFLHRFCYQELARRLNPKYDQTNSRSELQTLADNFISQAPVSRNKSVAIGSAAARIMSEKKWLPAWHTYAQPRRAEFDSRQGDDKNSQLYIQLLINENVDAKLNSYQIKTTNALKFFHAAAKSARYQLKLASEDKHRLMTSSFQGEDNLYGQYLKIQTSTRPNDNRTSNFFVQVKILDLVQCGQAPSLLQQFSSDPQAAGYKVLNNTALALQACYRKLWKAGTVFNFDDYETAKTMGGQVERQVRDRGELQLKTYNPIGREQIKLTGFNYVELYAATFITNELIRLKSRFRDSLGGDVNAGGEDFNVLVRQEYQRMTGIELGDKQQAKDLIAKHKQVLKQQALLGKLRGSESQDNVSTQLAVSGSAMKMQYYGRCIKGIGNNYYNCECLADAYVKEKNNHPTFSDYKFAKGSAYGQCYDAQATEKQVTLACESNGLTIFDCKCTGRTYVKLLSEAGIRRPTDRSAKDFTSKALSACSVSPKPKL